MNIYHNFPFLNIQDDEFAMHINSNQFNNSIPSNDENIIPLNELSSMKFELFQYNDGIFNDHDTDNMFMQYYRDIDTETKYYFEEDIVTDPSFKSNDDIELFSVCSYNINSLVKNFDYLNELLTVNLDSHFDVVGICESKLTDDIHHLYEIENYSKFVNNRSRNSGGLVLYVKNIFEFTDVRDDLNFKLDCFESLFVEVKQKNKNIIVGVIYRRPNSNVNEFLEKLDNILLTISAENKLCYITGDFNLDLLKHNKSNYTSQLISSFLSFNFHNTITRPTRVAHRSATLIDQLWTNNYLKMHKSGIIYSSVSDHFPIFTQFYQNLNKRDNVIVEEQYCRNYNDNAISRFNAELGEVDWSLVLAAADPQVAFTNFITIFKAMFDKHFPLSKKILNFKNKNKPYIDQNIRESMKEKRSLQKKLLNIP